ncbi:MAG: hypothetical protein AAGF11_06725 [Myxococcota bacterium]
MLLQHGPNEYGEIDFFCRGYFAAKVGHAFCAPFVRGLYPFSLLLLVTGHSEIGQRQTKKFIDDDRKRFNDPPTSF